MPADWLPAGESTDRLIHNSLKNRGRQIFFRSPFVDQWLDIRFRKDTASRGDRVELRVAGRHLAQARRVRVQKGGHLVDELSLIHI